MSKTIITVQTFINASIEKVWDSWTRAEHIINWNFASDDWCCPTAVNNLHQNGDFNWRMEAKDGSMGFDFTGTYEEIKNHELISYKMTDGRPVNIVFAQINQQVKLTESFEAENIHSEDMQRQGWQSILENFKQYVESNN